MKRLIILILSFLFVLSFSTAYAKVKGDAIVTDVEFKEPMIIPSMSLPHYDHIEMEGMRSLGNVGEPVLPIKGLKILIPPDTKVKDVEVILGEKVTLPGRYNIEPGQQEYPISQIGEIEIKPDEPKKEIYESDNPYPDTPKKFHSHQKKMGYSIAILNLHPVEYIPAKGEISYYKSMTVLVRFQEDKEPKPKNAPNLRGNKGVKEKDQEEIQRFIDNPEDLGLYTLTLREPISTTTSTTTTTSTSAPSTLSLGPIPAGQYSYVIITRSDFASSFEPLKQRRIQKGFTSTIVTTEWIYVNYPGTRPDGTTDNQTKIRNFIIDAYNTWGTRYVLLAGDGDGANLGGESEDPIIPARGLMGYVDSSPSMNDNNISADLYYSCLDGSFDYNKNGIYGERTDGVNWTEVDLLAEVYVGRACVDSAQGAINLVNKTLAYEDSTNSYLNNAYMLGEYLGFGGVSQYATESMEEIRLGTDAHGYTTQGFLSNPDKAFDTDTLYDAPDYSWSKSDLINIINNGIHILNHLGHASNTSDMKLNNSGVDSLTNSKYFIAYSQGCYPGAFDNRTTSSTTYITSDCIAEHLTTNSTGAVAFIGNSRYGWGAGNSTAGSSQYYDRQFWDALFEEGITELGKMNQDSKEDNIPYLSYDQNRWCYFELNLFGDPAVSVNLPNSLILRSDYSLLESLGDQDGIIDPGETIELSVTLRAFNQDAFNVFTTLSSQDPDVIIEQNNASYGIILKGESISNSSSPFRFKVSQDCPVPRNIKFTLTITATGYTKERNFSIEMPDPKERQITTSFVPQRHPDISGNYIVWEDYRNGGHPYIYLYDLSTNTERQITTDTVDRQNSPAISGNYIVWNDERNVTCSLYLYDLTTNTERQITTYGKNSPDISGNYIVYADWRNGNSDIYLYDLTTNTERQITTDTANQCLPGISGNYIVWKDTRNGNEDNCDVYLYDLTTNTERRITTNPSSKSYCCPAISGNYIVWEDYRDHSGDIYLYDLTTNTERRITTNPFQQHYPDISGNYIVWHDSRNGNSDIYLYDLTTNTERRITTNAAEQYCPAISGNYIVWHDLRNGSSDIYLYYLGDITPPTTPIVTDQGNYITNISQVLLGDLTHDSQISNADTTLCLRQATGLDPATGLADINKDGSVDITDVTLVSRMAQGLDPLQTVNIATLSASWTCSDPETGITEYQVALGTSQGATNIYKWRTTGTIASVSLPDTVVSLGSTYYFSVKAKNGAGLWSDMGYSDGITFTDTSAPTLTITSPVANAPVSNDGFTFTGTATDVGSGVKEVRVYVYDYGRSTYTVSYQPAIYNSTTKVWSFNVLSTHITPGKQARLWVGAYDNAGNWAGWYSVLVNVGQENQPPILNLIGNKSVNEGSLLQFTISATDQDGDTLTYSASNLPTGATFNSSTKVFSWTPNFSQAGIYSVTFSVSDGKGGTDSETITITVNNVELPPDGAPTNLTAQALSASSIRLSWQDNSTNETGFKIERSFYSTTGFTQIATVSANITTYTNIGLTKNKTYYYRVRAYNSVGNSSYSNTASATTLKR